MVHITLSIHLAVRRREPSLSLRLGAWPIKALHFCFCRQHLHIGLEKSAPILL